MAIDLKTVAHIAELSELELNNKELMKFKGELSKIIGYINKLRKLRPSKLEEPKLTPLRLREDKPEKTLPKEVVLSNAPKKERDYFVVPKVIKK
ncbi:MAG: Asp-tRNA(Asn)/Glu-tRNA(Gln) amidotransferase subunit GatC [bacterium]|nr:Asp-tRNA(Asn)/Glu-tRNA(Gln) amidotransferase subunit GatC [bacterium]